MRSFWQLELPRPQLPMSALPQPTQPLILHLRAALQLIILGSLLDLLIQSIVLLLS